MMRFILKSAARIATWSLAATLSALLLTACGLAEGLFAGGSSSTETGDKVALNGRVTGGSGSGVAGVIVNLGATGLADTTDITGSYNISGRIVRTSALDTLRFSLNGQTVAKRSVANLTATIPVIQIVQRGFSGLFTTTGHGTARVEGVLRGDGIAPGDSIAGTFFYNSLSNNYSGFLWFPPPTNMVYEYRVHINVYDQEGVLTGRSQSVPFNSFAGNITIPDFDPNTVNDVAPRPGTTEADALGFPTRSSP
jgi:hypothetical protein